MRSDCFLQTIAMYVAKHCVHSNMLVTVLHLGLLGLAWSSLSVEFENPSLSGNNSAMSTNSLASILATNFAGMRGSPTPMCRLLSVSKNVAGRTGNSVSDVLRCA